MIDLAHLTSWSNGLACLLPLGVCLQYGGWMGTGAVPGQPWEKAGGGVAGSSMGGAQAGTPG